MTKYVAIAIAVVALAAVAYSSNRAEEAEQKEPTVTEPKSTSTATSASASPVHRAGDAPVDPDAPGVDPEKIDWSRVDWRRRLTPEQYAIMREAGTERPGTGKYWKLFDSGNYNCAGCGLPLFESTAKFDAHCGWPSFDRTVDKKSIIEIVDNSHGMRRVEIRCRRCDSHLGHVFDDGPTDTGLRYCLNSASLDFEPAKGAVVKRKTDPKSDAKGDAESEGAEADATKADAAKSSDAPAAEQP
jgi:peptide-methionine (R)-S-oxide reductase